MAMPDTDTIEMVELQDVRDDESWATDPEKVDAFARHIEQGKRFSSLLLRRVWHEDASFHYEVIDGFHRYRALMRAGMVQHPATVIECDDRTADYDRAQASIDKPDVLLHKRALRAIQQGFVRDVREYGTHHLSERYISETGEVHIRQRAVTASDDPSSALMAIIEHETALRLHSRRHRFDIFSESTESEGDEDGIWEEEVWRAWLDQWLDEMCSWFGVKREWLLGDALALSALDLAEGDKTQRRIWTMLKRIPDIEVRYQLLARIKHERPGQNVLRLALERLGFNENALKKLFPKFQLGKTAMLRLIAGNTIEELCQQRQRQITDAETKRRPNSVRQDENADKPAVLRPGNEAVFTTVSPKFVASTPSSTPTVTEDDIIRSVDALTKLLAKYDAASGDWNTPKLRGSLLTLSTWLWERLSH